MGWLLLLGWGVDGWVPAKGGSFVASRISTCALRAPGGSFDGVYTNIIHGYSETQNKKEDQISTPHPPDNAESEVFSEVRVPRVRFF